MLALRRRYSAHRRRAAAAILARPSGVRAPVDIPPCSLHRPLASAWHWQAVPRRVLAPHLGRSCFMLLLHDARARDQPVKR